VPNSTGCFVFNSFTGLQLTAFPNTSNISLYLAFFSYTALVSYSQYVNN
jgi:hypothetical protein